MYVFVLKSGHVRVTALLERILRRLVGQCNGCVKFEFKYENSDSERQPLFLRTFYTNYKPKFKFFKNNRYSLFIFCPQ